MKKDIKQVNDIAKRYNMSKEERKEFGKFLEDQKKQGITGTLNEKGDFTYEELEQKAREFLENRRN